MTKQKQKEFYNVIKQALVRKYSIDQISTLLMNQGGVDAAQVNTIIQQYLQDNPINMLEVSYGGSSVVNIDVKTQPIQNYIDDAKLKAKVDAYTQQALVNLEPRIVVQPSQYKWNITTPAIRGIWQTDTETTVSYKVTAVDYAELDNLVVAASYDNKKLYFLDADTMQTKYPELSVPNLAYRVKTTPDGKRVIAQTYIDAKVHLAIIERDDNNIYSIKQDINLNNSVMWSRMAVNKTGDMVLVSDNGGSMNIYKMNNAGVFEEVISLPQVAGGGYYVRHDFITNDTVIVSSAGNKQIKSITIKDDNTYTTKDLVLDDWSYLQPTEDDDGVLGCSVDGNYLFFGEHLNDAASNNNGKIFVYAKSALDPYSTDPFGDGSLKHFYPLDGNTDDIVGGSNVTVNGNVTYVDAKYSKGIYPDKNSDSSYVSLGNPTIGAGKSITLSGWVYVVSTDGVENSFIQFSTGTGDFVNGNYQQFDINFGEDNNVDNGIFLGFKDSRATGGDNYHNYRIKASNTNLSDIVGKWTFVTATFDKDAKELKLYINGSLEGTLQDDTLSNAGTFAEGSQYSQIGNCVSGRYRDIEYDHIQIFNRALKQEEIQQLYGATIDNQYNYLETINPTKTNTNEQFGSGFGVSFDCSKMFINGYDSKTIYKYKQVVQQTTLDAYSTDPFGDNSLVHFYPLDNNADDLVGGSNGTVNGNATYIDAKFNKGVNGDPLISLDASLTNDISKNISLWFATGSNINDEQIIIDTYQNDAGWGNYEIMIKDNKLKIGGRTEEHNNNNYHIFFESNDNLLTNTTYHLYIRYDSSTNKREVFLDGSKIGEFTDNVYEPTNPYPATVGFFENSDTIGSNSIMKIQGVVDHIQIFNRALTEEEITKLYNATIQ